MKNSSDLNGTDANVYRSKLLTYSILANLHRLIYIYIYILDTI